MDRDRDRDFERGVPRQLDAAASLADQPRQRHEHSQKLLLLEQSERGDAARERLLQREAGLREFGEELRALHERGAQIDKLSRDARFREREKAVVEILAASFSLKAYADVSRDRANNWDALDPREKLQLLRLAEARVAIFEDVDPSDVLPYLSTKYVSCFDSGRNEIRFHEKQVLEIATEDQALLLLVHEQTHRTQYEALKNPDKYPYFSQALIAEWRENWDDRKEPGDTKESKELYAAQPLEKYADERSDRIVGAMYDYRRRH